MNVFRKTRLGMVAAAVIILATFGWHSTRPPAANLDFAVEFRGSKGPLIVLLGGSEGGFLDAPAFLRELEEHGYRTARLAYFDFPDGPEHLNSVKVDRIADAIRQMPSPPDCTGVFGVSKGAELALLISSYGETRHPTVAMVPSHVVWQASNVSLPRRSSWVKDDAALPFVRYPIFSMATVRAVLNLDDALWLHQSALQNAPEAAVIPVEKSKSPVLLQSARGDQIWPSYQMANAVMERLDRLGVAHAVRHIPYAWDHYLLRSVQARRDVISFFDTHLADCRTEG